MPAVQSYRDLVVWQKSMALVREVYRYIQSFPKAEASGLTTQLRRAAVSVPSNIAEGQGRLSTGEFKQFLGHARGSLLELETQILIAQDPGLSSGGSDTQSTSARSRDRARSKWGAWVRTKSQVALTTDR